MQNSGGGARTKGLDAMRREIFLPTAQVEPGQTGRRPQMKPGSFEIVVVGQKQGRTPQEHEHETERGAAAWDEVDSRAG